MIKFFFDLRSDDSLSLDEEGEELPDVEAAHEEALGALTPFRTVSCKVSPTNSLWWRSATNLGRCLKLPQC